jgi:hypothetical protein
MKLTTHLHPVLRLRMSGTILYSPHTPPWCGQGQLYFQCAAVEHKSAGNLFFLYSTKCTQEQMHYHFSKQSPSVDTFVVLVREISDAICTE